MTKTNNPKAAPRIEVLAPHGGFLGGKVDLTFKPHGHGQPHTVKQVDASAPIDWGKRKPLPAGKYAVTVHPADGSAPFTATATVAAHGGEPIRVIASTVPPIRGGKGTSGGAQTGGGPVRGGGGAGGHAPHGGGPSHGGPGDKEPQGSVDGALVDEDGEPREGATIVLYEQALRARTRLVESRTDSKGEFHLKYARPRPLNLVVQALDAHGAVLATSPVLFAAAAEVTVSLTAAGDGVAVGPSMYTRLTRAVTAQLGRTLLQDLRQDKDHQEVEFVAKSIGANFIAVAHLYIARRLALAHGLADATLFGIFSQRIPPSLDAALGNLPDAGIDDEFLAQILAGVLAHTRAALTAALDAARKANVLPASYAKTQDAELARLDALRVQATDNAPYIRGKTPLKELLAASRVDAAARTAFTEAYAAAGKRLGPTWKALRANKALTKEQRAQLNTTLSVGELLGGNLPLVQDTLQRLTKGSLASVQDLALLDQADWVARIEQIDPNATSIPSVLPDDTPALRIARLAKALAERLASRYPTTAFLGGLQKATDSSFANKGELVKVLSANPKLDFRRTNIDQYVLKNKLTIPQSALAELKTAQRLQRLSPHFATVNALNAAGFRSAQAIYFAGRTAFITRMTQPMGGAALAKAAWRRAQTTYAAALAAYGRFNINFNPIHFAVVPSQVPAPAAVAQLPDLQALFGSQDSCACSDCRSVTSPAAYLVDLLQFLKARAAQAPFGNARDALLARRPDLQYVALGCKDTEITLPYIDVVNELLEAAIAPPATPVTLVTTTGSSAERRALPQRISQAAYATTANAVFPLSLPFDLPFAETTSFLAALGTSLDALLKLCRRGNAAAQAAAQLGLNPTMQAAINGSDTHHAWEHWGFSAETNPPGVYDPNTRELWSPAPADWIAALAHVPVFLDRAGLTYAQLCQLLEGAWVTGGTVKLTLGTMPSGGAQVLSCNTELMNITGLDADALERTHRFLRLWQATQLDMWELDWAVAAGGATLNDAFLAFLAGALGLRGQLGLPLQELLCFWGPMLVTDTVSHLGDADEVIPSTYTKVFRNPTLLAAWPTVFVAPGALSGSAILVPATPPPAPAALANQNAIKAALGLSADDIAAILAASGAANALTMDTLNVLFRYARLASALSLGIPDLVLWITLADAHPFGATPAATAEFVRRLGVLQGTGMTAHDLDYLLRAGSETETALAFTTTQVTTVLQIVRDALAKLTPAARADAPTVQAIIVSALATATGASANLVSGVLAGTGILPLPPATVTLLLGQAAGVDATAFPQLVAAFTQVAKATALFGALHPAESEFLFAVAHAGPFQWLDAGALPLTPPAASLYVPFERLLQALRLDQRQVARTPKLFDVLGTWLTNLPANQTSAVHGDNGALATALAAGVPDVEALAVALGATAPSLTPATQPGSLADVAMLAAIADCLDAAARFKIGAATLLQLASTPPTSASATAAMGVFQARYTPSAWFGALQPIEDALRSARRDALVAYLIGHGPATPITPPLFTSDDLFNHYLIDPEMCPCGSTTRLLEASLAVQQFVQQCSLGLVSAVVVDATADPGWNAWDWMSQYRVWQANREVFLYPENYLLPELRTDKSPFFADLENDLAQTDCDADAVDAAFQNYLRKLVEVANLVIAAHYQEIRPGDTRVLHVFAHTRGTPPKWYYRTRTSIGVGTGIWSAWQALKLDIPAGQLVPVVWDQRLHLVWPVFKQISEKASNQNVPTSTSGGTSSPAKKFWSVEFAMSELSAGQWQPKRTYDQKCYFQIDAPSNVFTFRAFQDASFNLQLQAYQNEINVDRPTIGSLGFDFFGWSFSGPEISRGLTATNRLVATGTLTMPDAPLAASERALLPDASKVDQSQEPTYSLITTLNQTGQLAQPSLYRYSAQDLVYFGSGHAGGPQILPSTPVPLYVLVAASSKTPAANIELLTTIASPRIVVPPQEPAFDSADPFFVTEPARSYLVQPHYYTVSSSPTELASTMYIPQWTTSFAFQTFYHPFARTFLRELEIGGTDRLMKRNLQINPQAVRAQGSYDFAALYHPTGAVMRPYPVEDVDFSVGGAYSLYNWELFYHAPMYVATQLLRNHQYPAAMQWLEHIFDPTDAQAGAVPQHFWITRPFYEMNASDWLAQQIQQILASLAAGSPSSGGSDTAAALADWVAHPFDPHRVARLRIAAYGKATVMKFLDNLIAWGDSLYAQYTMEKVAQAEQLYVFANLILGPEPALVRLPDADMQSDPDATTYAAIEGKLDAFSNELVAVENVIATPASGTQVADPGTPTPPLPQVSTLFFCIPPNDQMLAYWSTVADRLYKIRHCLNLQGVAQPLPLYAPPINPLQLVAQAAGGGGGAFGAPTFTPVYRFTTYLEQALALTNDVRAYGALVLAALEKKDAEALAALHAHQNLDIQTRLLEIKNAEVTEAQQQVTVLQDQKAAVKVRHDFYTQVAFMNAWEITALALHGAALIANGVALVLDATAGGVALIPTVTFGAAGFGGSPVATVSISGQAIGQSASSFANVARGIGGLLDQGGGMAATVGEYQRRQDDWTLQANVAAAELVQLDAQIAAANERVTIATAEVDLQSRQIDNAQAVDTFLADKYTNEQLYDWMLTQLTTVHTQAYQLAFGLAQRAQATYQYELGSTDSFLQFGYWDSQHKGLTAADSLLFDLRRMQAQYLEANTRELELVKHVSLALTQPLALVQLLQTGTCQLALDEQLFDLDHPGHYFRRLRSVALTVPCVTGPYAGVNATLSLNQATVRVQPPTSPYTPAAASAPPASASFITSPAPATASISTSQGRDDAGLFDVNLHDPRWLPFEGQGAISMWTLTLDPRDNAFDFSTISDVVLHLRYTARAAGGSPEAVRSALKPKGERKILLSVHGSFSDAYYTFFHPADPTAAEQVLSLPLAANVLPFSNLGAPKITDIGVYFALAKAPPTGAEIGASFGPTGGPATAVSLAQVPGSTGSGASIAALGADVDLTAPTSPGSFTLTVPEASVPAALTIATDGHNRLDATAIEDIVLVVSYKIG